MSSLGRDRSLITCSWGDFLSHFFLCACEVAPIAPRDSLHCDPHSYLPSPPSTPPSGTLSLPPSLSPPSLSTPSLSPPFPLSVSPSRHCLPFPLSFFFFGLLAEELQGTRGEGGEQTAFDPLAHATDSSPSRPRRPPHFCCRVLSLLLLPAAILMAIVWRLPPNIVSLFLAIFFWLWVCVGVVWAAMAVGVLVLVVVVVDALPAI